jgi:hypothetical protein
MWRVYLDVNGQRYEGQIQKRKGTLEDIQAIYPTQNRFSTPYEITFGVPVTAIETQRARLTLTSALGTSTLSFSSK